MKITKTMVKVIIWAVIIGLVLSQLSSMMWFIKLLGNMCGITYDKVWGVGIITKQYGTWYGTIGETIKWTLIRTAIVCGLLFLRNVINGEADKGIRVA